MFTFYLIHQFFSSLCLTWLTSYHTLIMSLAFLLFFPLNCRPFVPFSPKLWHLQMNIPQYVAACLAGSSVRHSRSELECCASARVFQECVHLFASCVSQTAVAFKVLKNKTETKLKIKILLQFSAKLASLPGACASNLSLRNWTDYLDHIQRSSFKFSTSQLLLSHASQRFLFLQFRGFPTSIHDSSSKGFRTQEQKN